MSSRNSEFEETASQRSGTSGTSGNASGLGGSETSSQRSDSKFLKRERAHAEREEGDLLEENRSLQDGVFSCMYTLVRQSALSNWKFSVLKCVLEGLMGLIVVFNPSVEAWRINTNNPVWQVIRWTVWRSPIARLFGYQTYLVVLYIMIGAVFLAVAGLVWLTLAMRRTEQSKWLRISAMVLHIVYDVMFTMFYVSFFDYFVFTANCTFTSEDKMHVHFDGVKCLEMPHILHMSIALFTAALFFCVTALFVVASCDLNPISLGYLASPAAIVRLKILIAKAAFVIAADDLQSWAKPQALLVDLAVLMICWWNFRRLPFYRTTVNIIWCSFWFGVLYVAGLLTYLVFGNDHSEQHHKDVTMLVLYGIFPAIALGWVACGVHAWWAARPAKLFKNLPLGVKISKIYKFQGVEEVEILSRAMRKFGLDNVVDEEAAALGEVIIKAGIQTYPSNPYLLILYANYLLEVKKDGPASRTQLQLASRHSPSTVERYQIFCTNEASKRLKDSQDSGMDLQAYIEFRRNFRAVLRVHKEVLLLQADLWMLMLRDTLRVTDVDRALDALEVGTIRAHQVYKRVLERYPTNGKLLRCYGKFLEDVRHDPVAAARAYSEANRNGGGDAIMSLDLSNVQGASHKPEFLTSMSMEDDAVIVINAEGQIMMSSQAVQTVFGYPKTELEGANVSVLMPQPFSQRHTGYLQRYTTGGEPHILDTVREVVGLHKERYVFPLALCVTKINGTGADSIFLGVARPLPANSTNVRAWLAPNGVFLCGDQQFASLCGVVESDLIGRTLASMVDTEPLEVEQLLERCRDAPPEAFLAKTLRVPLLLKHRYLESVPVDVTVSLAGTEVQRIFVLNCVRTDGQDGNTIVVDSHMRLRFASCGVTTLLGFSMRKLSSMRLDQLLPPPFNTLHSKYLRDPPSNVPITSCRSGKVVHLLNENGASVPVRLKISTVQAADLAMMLYVVQIEKKGPDEVNDEKRLVVTSNFSGRMLSVSQPESDLFGFRAADLVGCNLCDTIDIFEEWRNRAGESQMQLLMLALLDKEQEMPGTSWRVRVHHPATEGAPHLPTVPGAQPAPAAAPGKVSKSACLQVELEEDVVAAADEGAEAAAGGTRGAGDGGGLFEGSVAASSAAATTRIRVTLWRRDLLTGVVELDEELIIRKASPLTGLIVGMPATAMLKKPVQRFLDIPLNTTWEKLAEAHNRHKQKGGLKAPTGRGVISPPMAFIGPHPDTGTMRIVIQGVQVLAPGGRSKVILTMHPDTAFAGAHADLMRVLHLDAAMRQEQQQGRMHEQQRRMTDAGVGAADPGKADGAGGGSDKEDTAGDDSAKQLATLEEAEGDPGAADGEEHHSGDEGNDDVGEMGSDHGRRQRRGLVPDEVPVPDADVPGQAKLHSRASSKSDFVAQWVRTLTKKRSGQQQDPPGDQEVRTTSSAGAAAGGGGKDGDPAAAAAVAEAAGPSQLLALPAPPGLPPRTSGGLHSKASTLAPIPEDGQKVGKSGLDGSSRKHGHSMTRGGSGGGGGDQDWNPPGSRQTSRSLSTPPTGQQRGKGADSAEPGSEAGGDGAAAAAAGEKWEKGSEGDSSADGSQAVSGVTGTTDQTGANELVIDSRRCRLLKALTKLLMGPVLLAPMERLRVHSYALLAIMVVTHVIAYIVIDRQMQAQHHEVELVYRQALAMDRSQLIAVRCMMGAFCERDNVTAKVSVCANSLEYTLEKLKTNIDLMEQHHQYVYLGESSSKVVKLMPEVYNVWTQQQFVYHSYMDTSSPHITHDAGGAWVIGNRFLAAAREALYWLPAIREEYRLHRTYEFLVDNGLGPLFTCYAKSLDLLVDSAWKSVDALSKTLLVLLLIEPLFIQLCCLAYEWLLVQRLERARLVGILAMVGLPGPVLRQLATKEAKVLDNSDDDEDDEHSDAEEEQQLQEAAKAAAAAAAAGDGGAVASHANAAGAGQQGASRGVRHADSGDGTAPGAEPGQQPSQPAKLLSVKQMERERSTAAIMPQSPMMDASEVVSIAAPEGGGKLGAGLESGSGKGALLGKDVPQQEQQQKQLAFRQGSGLQDRTQARVGWTGSGGPAERDKDKEKSRSGKMLPFFDGFDGVGAKLRRARVRGLQIDGKELVPSFYNISKFMAPFVLWNAAIIIVYVVSLVELQGMQGPLASLNMASHIIYRYTRVRAIAFGFVSQDDVASRTLWRQMLSTELRYFESEYDALMYGGVPITQLNSVFQHAVPSSTFASTAFANEFFRSKRCFRYDQNECREPGDEYYEVSHNGLDVMVRRMIAEMRLLSEDSDEDVAYNSSRYMYMYQVGGRDLYEGLQYAAQLFVDYSNSLYDSVQRLHTVLLIVTICLVALYLFLVLWPHLTRLKNDAAWQSALLSHVPPEVDVRSHVRAVFKRALGRRQRVANNKIVPAPAAHVAMTPLA